MVWLFYKNFRTYAFRLTKRWDRVKDLDEVYSVFMSGRAKCDKEKIHLFLLADPRDAHCTKPFGSYRICLTMQWIVFEARGIYGEGFIRRKQRSYWEYWPYKCWWYCYRQDIFWGAIQWSGTPTILGRKHKTINGIGSSRFCCDNGGRGSGKLSVYEGEKSKMNSSGNDGRGTFMGSRPCIVTGDAWYGSIENLKF